MSGFITIQELSERRHAEAIEELYLVEYFQNPVVTESGEERIIAWHNTVLKDGNDSITGTLATGEDITERNRAEKELLRVQLGVTLATDDFVFIRPDGSPINPNAVTLAYRRIINKAGLRHIRIHDLRHTHATLMLQAGVHPKVVSERLGRANIGIMMDIYSHVLPGIQEASAEKFDQIFNEDVGENSSTNVGKMLAENEGLSGRPNISIAQPEWHLFRTGYCSLTTK